MLGAGALGPPYPDDRHDSRARDGRSAAGERGPSGHGDGTRAARVSPLPRRDAAQPGRPGLAGPRPVRPLGRHACMLQYAALHLAGYDLTLDDLRQFRQWGSRTPGHPELGHTAGIETTTGPLGQGFANGVGMAIAQRFLADRYNRPQPRDRGLVGLLDLLRRRHDGGRHPGGSIARGPPRARPSRLRLRRQPHHDRRHDGALVHDRRQGQALRGLRLARPTHR